MTMFQAPLNLPEPIRLILTDTTTTEIIPPTGAKQPISKIHICNVTAGAVTVDIEVFDGTTSFYLEKGKSLGANASFDILDEVLQSEHSLRAKAGTGNALHVSAIYSAAVRGA